MAGQLPARKRRPQRGVEARLKAGDGGDVGPGPAVEDVTDGLPVDAQLVGGRPSAPAAGVQSGGQAAGDGLDDCCGDVVDESVGPVLRIAGQFPGRTGARRPSDHASTLLLVEVVRDLSGRLSCHYSWSMALDAATSSVIDGYAPREASAVWDAVGPLVRAVVAATVARLSVLGGGSAARRRPAGHLGGGPRCGP